MKLKNCIIIGSKAFFEGLEGFNPKDTDYLYLSLHPQGYKFCRQTSAFKEGNFCLFEWKWLSAEGFVRYALKNPNPPMQIGKFLVPAFVKKVGLTIEQLKRLEPLINSLDERHTYEKVIYDAYIENNDFYLTDEQRIKAFEEYKKKRVK